MSSLLLLLHLPVVLSLGQTSSMTCTDGTVGNYTQGVIFGYQKDVGFDDSFAESLESCCSICNSVYECASWTWHQDDGTCILHGGTTPVHSSDDNHFSGLRNTPIPSLPARACSGDNADYPFCDVTVPLEDRVQDLISRLTLEEKPFLLVARESPLGNISRLGIPEYDWGLSIPRALTHSHTHSHTLTD